MLVTNDGYNKEVSYMVNNSKNYRSLIKDIGSILEEGRKQAFRVVNNILTKTYWEIGSQIVEFEQIGNEKAAYGSKLLHRLSKDLRLTYGKGFSRRNILDMRRFYIIYPKWRTVSAKLSWSQYVELLRIDENIKTLDGEAR